MQPEQSESTGPDTTRRAFMGKAAAAGAAAWAAPVLISSTAHAQGTGPLPPVVSVQNNRESLSPSTNTVGGASGNGDGEILWALVPLQAGPDTIAVTPSPGPSGVPWTTLVSGYDSTSTVPGTSSPPGSDERLRLYVWARYGAGTLTDTNVSATLTGNGLRGSWRLGVLVFDGVQFIANDPGEVLAQGNNGLNATVTGPAITNNSVNAWSIWIGGGDLNLESVSTPSGYTSFENNIFQPPHRVAALANAPASIPAATASLTSTQHTVGVQLTVEG